MSVSFRTALYYFSQFWSGGAFHAYGGIWFASLGFTATQIGLTTTVPTFIVLLTNIFVGKLADRAKDWRQVLVICGFISLVGAVGLNFVNGFYPVFIFWSLSIIAQTLSVPVGDAAATYLAHEGRGTIGMMRGLATIGYLLSLFATGYAIQGFGGGIFALLFAGFSAFRAITAILLPPFKSTAAPKASANTTTGLRQLLQPWLLFPLLGWSIVYATIQVLNSFFALAMKQQGIDEGMISWIIGWGALNEALVFLTFARFQHLLNLRSWIVISCVATAFRWFAMGTAPGVVMLFALQTLHGVSYALGFVACATYIGKRTSPSVAAEAQSTFNVIQMIAAVIIITGFGALYELLEEKTFYVSGVVALAGTCIALLALWFTPPAPTRPDQSA